MKPRNNWIYEELSENDFKEFLFPHITSGLRGRNQKSRTLRCLIIFVLNAHGMSVV